MAKHRSWSVDPGGFGALRRVNLNLLPILHALLRSRSVSRAAHDLHLSQPAVSASLRKLREHFGDALLVQHGHSMDLTARARGLLGALEQTLEAATALLGEPPFDPGTTTRRYRIAAADYLAAISVPAAARLMAAEAPRASLHAFNASTKSADELLIGDIDLIVVPEGLSELISIRRGVAEGSILRELIFEDRLVGVVSEKNRFKKRKLDRQEYLRRPHAAFALEPGLHASLEVEGLVAQHLEQHDRVVLGSFLLLPFVSAVTDCVAVVPRWVAEMFAKPLGLRIVEIPVRFTPIRLHMHWTRSQDADPGHRWFRELFRRAIREAPEKLWPRR